MCFAENEKSVKNGRIGAHGLNCIIFVNFELIFEIYDKNYSRKKKINVSTTLLKFSQFLKFWQFLRFRMAILAKWPYILPIFFRDFWWKCRPLYSGRVWEWSDESSRKCQKWTNWRSRVTLHNFGQFWAHIWNLR